MHSLLRVLEHRGVPDAAAKALLIVVLFAAASLIARAARLLARALEARGARDDRVSPLLALSRRETAVSLVQTTVRYIAFLVAFALAVVVLTGGRSIGTVAGASFLAVLIAFAAQRFLIDVMAGLVMYFEGWFTVGTSVVIEPYKLEGVVEEMSLRATTVRDASGDLLHVHNSQIAAVRVLPGGARTVDIELFVRDRAAGERLFEEVSALVPVGPTAFLARPAIRNADELAGELCRITGTASVPAGRLWLVEELLPSLVKERADDELLVHGPVVLTVDEQATSRFRRAGRRVYGAAFRGTIAP